MAEPPRFPWIYYSPTAPSRIFESAEELAAAGEHWYLTPDEAAEAAALAAEPVAEPEPEAPHSTRSRR